MSSVEQVADWAVLVSTAIDGSVISFEAHLNGCQKQRQHNGTVAARAASAGVPTERLPELPLPPPSKLDGGKFAQSPRPAFFHKSIKRQIGLLVNSSIQAELGRLSDLSYSLH